MRVKEEPHFGEGGFSEFVRKKKRMMWRRMTRQGDVDVVAENSR